MKVKQFAFFLAKVYNYSLGQVQTYRYPNLLKAVNWEDGTAFMLYPNASFYIWVHDPNYFILTGRPLVFPGIFKKYKVLL